MPKKAKNMYYFYVYFICERLIFILILIWILFGISNLILLKQGALSLLAVSFVSETTKYFYPTQRPKKPLLGPKWDSSFPSSHAALSFCIATSYLLWGNSVLVAYILFVLAGFVALGRYLGGAHYIKDVVGGAIIAMVIVYLIYITNLSLIIPNA